MSDDDQALRAPCICDRMGRGAAFHTRECEASWATSVLAVTKPNMVMRSLRVPADLWEKARAKADERGENISDVIREALERYVRRR